MSHLPEWFFTFMTIDLILTVIISEWFASKGIMKVVYPLNALKFLGFIILETGIAINHPEQKAIFLFNISNAWGLVMNLKGMYRLYCEKNHEIQQKE